VVVNTFTIKDPYLIIFNFAKREDNIAQASVEDAKRESANSLLASLVGFRVDDLLGDLDGRLAATTGDTGASVARGNRQS
jgi:hypothetical protein